MSYSDNEIPATNEILLERMRELENRVAYLESEAGFAPARPKRSAKMQDGEAEEEETLSGSFLESRFGEHGLAWMGNLVLLFGIIFLEQYMQNVGQKFLASAIGYLVVTGMFGVGYYYRNTLSNLASIFRLNGYVLLYFVTLRLHFFTKDPIITNPAVCLVLLMAVSIALGYFAFRHQSQRLVVLALIMAAITAIVSDTTHFMNIVMVITAVYSIYLLIRFGWWRLLFLTIFLVYFVSLIWLLDNPFMHNSLQALKVHHGGYIYLFIVAAVFSFLALVKQRGLFPDNSIITAIILNGLGFSFLMTFHVLAFHKDSYVPIFASIAAFCMIYSVILQSRSNWKITGSLYALYGFVALSVMVYGVYNFPRAYFLLSIQSLLVVSMALWFRSKVIVVMNTFLFIFLLLAYLLTSQTQDSINISFALVALVTARILNWQKERLNIKTELLRNTYLFIGFFMVLYALYRVVPGQYITLSWALAAVVYFVLSLLIHNVKYRYLALGTLAAAVIYLFIVDLARIDIAYRVVALLFLASISFALSLYYTKRHKKKSEG